jgi:hypothetical protein
MGGVNTFPTSEESNLLTNSPMVMPPMETAVEVETTDAVAVTNQMEHNTSWDNLCHDAECPR